MKVTEEQLVAAARELGQDEFTRADEENTGYFRLT